MSGPPPPPPSLQGGFIKIKPRKHQVVNVSTETEVAPLEETICFGVEQDPRTARTIPRPIKKKAEQLLESIRSDAFVISQQEVQSIKQRKVEEIQERLQSEREKQRQSTCERPLIAILEKKLASWLAFLGSHSCIESSLSWIVFNESERSCFTGPSLVDSTALVPIFKSDAFEGSLSQPVSNERARDFLLAYSERAQEICLLLKEGNIEQLNALDIPLRLFFTPQADLSCLKLKNSFLKQLFLPSADLSQCRWIGTNLLGARLEQSSGSGCLFQDVDLRESSLIGCIFEDSKFVKVDMRSSSLTFATFKQCTFENCRFDGGSTEATVYNAATQTLSEGVILEGCLFRSCNFQLCSLQGLKFGDQQKALACSFYECDFRGTNLSFANLVRVHIQLCLFDTVTCEWTRGGSTATFNVFSSTLDHADASHCSIVECDLSQLSVAHTCFSDASLTRCTIDRSRWRSAIVERVTLTDMEPEQL